MIKFDRVYHPVSDWEEISGNMWGAVNDRPLFLQMAFELTSNASLYGHYMERVINEWPISCENALTDYRINRKAWIGHAACALAIDCPEDITRKAWGMLTNGQRKLANGRAASAIRAWEERYAKSKGLRVDVGGPMLF